MQKSKKRDSSARFWMVLVPRVVVVVLLLAGSGGLYAVMVAAANNGDKQAPDAPMIRVQAIDSVHRPSDRTWSGYGTMRTMRSAQLVAEVSGRVIERPEGIEPGERVERGQLIVLLDDTDYLNNLDAARQALRSIEAQLDGLDVEREQTRLQVQYAEEEIEAARRDLSRIDAAIAAGAGSAGERDAVLAALLRSQRQLASLRQQLDLLPSRRLRLQAELSAQRAQERIASENVQRARITAPFDSELQTITPREGDWVAMGSEVARLVDLSRLELPLKLPASASSWVRQGDEVRLWVRELGGEPDRTGQVVRVAPEADPGSRTITVFVEVSQDPRDPNRLLPGQFVHARVTTHDEHDRVILPRRAVQSDSVYIAGPLENGYRVISQLPVKVAYSFEGRIPDLDPQETQWVALERGREPVQGSHVVVSLLDQVVEGMKVRLQRDPDPNPARENGTAGDPAPVQAQDDGTQDQSEGGDP